MSQGLCRNCGDRLNYAYKLCEQCWNRLEERPPDATGKLIAEFLEDWDDLRDFVLEAPILSSDIMDLKEYIHSIKDDIKTRRKKWEGRKK